jgi:hypothetical protein
MSGGSMVKGRVGRARHEEARAPARGSLQAAGAWLECSMPAALERNPDYVIAIITAFLSQM